MFLFKSSQIPDHKIPDNDWCEEQHSKMKVEPNVANEVHIKLGILSNQ